MFSSNSRGGTTSSQAVETCGTGGTRCLWGRQEHEPWDVHVALTNLHVYFFCIGQAIALPRGNIQFSGILRLRMPFLAAINTWKRAGWLGSRTHPKTIKYDYCRYFDTSTPDTSDWWRQSNRSTHLSEPWMSVGCDFSKTWRVIMMSSHHVSGPKKRRKLFLSFHSSAGAWLLIVFVGCRGVFISTSRKEYDLVS